ncbi:MAG: hypothetical protein OXC96_09195 [Cyanobacteria bacterium MAG CAR1_bin_15]|nr:hypothetical protein [Cyanobacteria bacterium MAG CAR1_bin_15]
MVSESCWGAPGAGQVGGWLAAWLLYQAVVRLVLPLVGKSKDRRADRRSSPYAVRLDGGGGLGLRSRSP